MGVIMSEDAMKSEAVIKEQEKFDTYRKCMEEKFSVIIEKIIECCWENHFFMCCDGDREKSLNEEIIKHIMKGEFPRVIFRIQKKFLGYWKFDDKDCSRIYFGIKKAAEQMMEECIEAYLEKIEMG